MDLSQRLQMSITTKLVSYASLKSCLLLRKSGFRIWDQDVHTNAYSAFREWNYPVIQVEIVGFRDKGANCYGEMIGLSHAGRKQGLTILVILARRFGSAK